MTSPKRTHRGARPKPARGEYTMVRVTAAAHDAAVQLALDSDRTLTELVSSILLNIKERLDADD